MSPAADARSGTHTGGDDPRLDLVFGALSDPTRRHVLQTLMRAGTTSVPELTADLPISRQAVAKHIAALDGAGLLERAPAPGREVHYRLRPSALTPAAGWLSDAQSAWPQRLARLKASVESGGRVPRRSDKS